MNKPKAVNFYLDYLENFEYLTDEQVGKLTRAILRYASDGKMPEMEQILMVAFMPIKKNIDADFEKYAEKCEKNKANGSKGGRLKANGSLENRTVFSETQKSQEEKEEEEEKEKEHSNECKESKTEYAENVMLTDSQYQALCNKYGTSVTNSAIEVVSAYKCSSGKKYKSDYHAILSWGIDRVKERMGSAAKNKSSTEIFGKYLT